MNVEKIETCEMDFSFYIIYRNTITFNFGELTRYYVKTHFTPQFLNGNMTADDVRVQLCRKMLDEGAPQRTICSLLHMSASTVSAIKKAGDAPFEWKKCGRKPCVTEEMKNFIEMTLSADATITDDEMRRFVRRRFGADISVSSVRRTRNLLKFV